MKKLLAGIFVLLFLSGCSDNSRTDLEEIEGVECVVVRDGFGRIKFVDCNWEE